MVARDHGLLLGLVALLAGGADASASVRDPRVTAFDSVCVPDRQNFDATKDRASADSWSPVEPAAHPEFKAVMDMSAAALAGKTDMGSRGATFAREIAGGTKYLVVIELTSEMIALVSCYFYDFEAEAPLAVDALNELLGEEPHETIDQPGQLVSQKWDTPAKLAGAWDAYAGFVPEGSAIGAQIGFTGLVLRITSVDPEDEPRPPADGLGSRVMGQPGPKWRIHWA